MNQPRRGQPGNRRTIEQERAQQAWEAIEDMRNHDKKGEYGSRARNLPSMIQTNGLGATLAFLRARSGGETNAPEQKLYQQVSERVKHFLGFQQADLLAFIRDERTSTDQYRQATAEAIAFSIWIKRYVEAEGWKASN